MPKVRGGKKIVKIIRFFVAINIEGLSKVRYFICGCRHIWLNLIREDRHKFLHLHMDNRHLSYIFKFLKKILSYRNLLFLMYSCTVRYPRHVLRCSGYMTPNGYVTDGRTDCGRPSVRRRRPSVCPSSLSFCSGVVCTSVAAALLSCSAAVFFSHRRVAFLLSQSGF